MQRLFTRTLTLLLLVLLAGSPVLAQGDPPAPVYLPLISRTPDILRSVGPLAAGYDHNCALTDTGGIKCWGGNYAGQLGDGTINDRSRPVSVAGLNTTMKEIAGGYSHTCARTGAGGVKCWGYNDRGQLGDGTRTSRSTPIDVVGLSVGVRAIATGGSHSCALMSDGGIKCWGDNWNGQLGNNREPVWYGTPTDVVRLGVAVTAIATGGSHTCTLTVAGGVKCWGNNYYGGVGDGTTTDRSTPVDVVGLSAGVQAIAAGGGHTCALLNTGGVWCWGVNMTGQAGNGTWIDRHTAGDVVGLSTGVQAIAAGSSHTCALMVTGGVKCWGSNMHGQLGVGGELASNTPVDVYGLASGVVAIVLGGNTSCALIETGGVMCWGANNYGQLGDGTHVERNTPVAVLPG